MAQTTADEPQRLLDDESEQARHLVARLRRLHSALGTALLPAYLIYHLWEHWPALSGVEQWQRRVEAGLTGPTTAMLLALPIVLHGCVGLGLSLGASKLDATAGTRDAEQAALRPLRMVTGSLVLVFLLYHLWHVGMLAPGPHGTVVVVFGRLWHDLGRPLPLVIYVVGVSATCMHLGLGLSKVAVARLMGRPRAARWAPLAVGAVVGPVWIMFMELIAFFANGEGLWPG